MDEAKEGKRIVYFVDAVHFVFGVFLGMVWTFVRIFVTAPAGRQRYNVLGAINAITHEFSMVANETYINALSVCELMEKLKEQYKETLMPITLVMDNAKYQHCNLVELKALELGIELLFLPTYSPNLNIIERLWKFTKSRCLNCRTYKDFSEFKSSVYTFLSNLERHNHELKTLLSLKFQTFKNSQIIAC